MRSKVTNHREEFYFLGQDVVKDYSGLKVKKHLTISFFVQ